MIIPYMRVHYWDRQDEFTGKTDNDFSIARNHETPADVLVVWSTCLMAVREVISFSH
jgi:hypothetical protein